MSIKHKGFNTTLPNTWATNGFYLFWPQIYTNPKRTLCQRIDIDTWPHLLSICKSKFLKGLQIAQHNATTHQLANLLKSCIHIRLYTSIKAWTKPTHHKTSLSHLGSFNAHAAPQNATPSKTTTRHPIHIRPNNQSDWTINLLTELHHTNHRIYLHKWQSHIHAINTKHEKYNPLIDAIWVR